MLVIYIVGFIALFCLSTYLHIRKGNITLVDIWDSLGISVYWPVYIFFVTVFFVVNLLAGKR